MWTSSHSEVPCALANSVPPWAIIHMHLYCSTKDKKRICSPFSIPISIPVTVIVFREGGCTVFIVYRKTDETALFASHDPSSPGGDVHGIQILLSDPHTSLKLSLKLISAPPIIARGLPLTMQRGPRSARRFRHGLSRDCAVGQSRLHMSKDAHILR
jgi:hypothetical protein